MIGAGGAGTRRGPTTRVQLEMPAKAMEHLRWLKDHFEAASYAEIVRKAVSELYERHKAGRKTK